ACAYSASRCKAEAYPPCRRRLHPARAEKNCRAQPNRLGGSLALPYTLSVLCLVLATPPAQAADVQRGKALFALAAGCGCHTPEQGPVGAGGGEVATPFG